MNEGALINLHIETVHTLRLSIHWYSVYPCVMSKRVSLILKDADEAAIAPYLSEGSAAFEVLRQWAGRRGEGDIKSEAGALRALLQAGAEALGERVLDAGYAQLAEEFNGEPARAERRSARDHYTRRTEAQL